MTSIEESAPSKFGWEPKIQTVDPNVIRIVYKAVLFDYCCGYRSCQAPSRREYFYVLENAYEQNSPWQVCGGYGCPEGCCFPVYDCVFKTYFDKGLYDKQNACWYLGCYKGEGSFVEQRKEFRFCWADCCECYNNFATCYYPEYFGESLYYLSCETWCCCLSTRAGGCSNCCNGFGPKNGTPTMECCVVPCLAKGESLNVSNALNNSRSAWLARTGGGVA